MSCHLIQTYWKILFFSFDPITNKHILLFLHKMLFVLHRLVADKSLLHVEQ